MTTTTSTGRSNSCLVGRWGDRDRGSGEVRDMRVRRWRASAFAWCNVNAGWGARGGGAINVVRHRLRKQSARYAARLSAAHWSYSEGYEVHFHRWLCQQPCTKHAFADVRGEVIRPGSTFDKIWRARLLMLACRINLLLNKYAHLERLSAEACRKFVKGCMSKSGAPCEIFPAFFKVTLASALHCVFLSYTFNARQLSLPWMNE